MACEYFLPTFEHNMAWALKKSFLYMRLPDAVSQPQRKNADARFVYLTDPDLSNLVAELVKIHPLIPQHRINDVLQALVSLSSYILVPSSNVAFTGTGETWYQSHLQIWIGVSTGSAEVPTAIAAIRA